MTDHSELKRLAEAAPEGPWFGPEYAPGTSYVFDVDLGTLLAYESIDSEKDACLRYVAAANPATVLALIAEIEKLKGLSPSLPPRPPEGDGLPRFGLRWNGPGNPLAVSMDDGYWTPWHLADQLKAENEVLVSAMNEILRVTPMGVEAFGIAALVLGELGVSKEASK
jgi:hypothetical protein